MNPLSNVKSLNKLNEREIELGVVGTSGSWHKRYRESAWIFFGGVPFELTEGDLICVFSQYGEIVNINLVRDKKTGKSKGFGFVCYEDQRSTDLAVDNFNGIKLIGRIMRVDHVLDYRPPKDDENEDDIISQFLKSKGCAPDTIQEKLKQLKDSKEKKPETQSQNSHRNAANKNYRRRSKSRSRSISSNDERNMKFKEIKIKKEPTSEEEREKKKKRDERNRESQRDQRLHHHHSDRDKERDRDSHRHHHHHDHKSHSRHRSRSKERSRSSRSRTPSRSMSTQNKHHKHHSNR